MHASPAPNGNYRLAFEIQTERDCNSCFTVDVCHRPLLDRAEEAAGTAAEAAGPALAGAGSAAPPSTFNNCNTTQIAAVFV